jgi:carboxyl-terminal processing protease
LLGGEGEIIIKRVVKYFLVSVIIAAGLLFTAIPLGATNAEDVVSPAAIVEQRSHRLLSYSSADTPEEQVRYWLQRFYVDPVSESVLNAESIDEMIRLLNDPYTCFLTPEQYNSFISPGQSGIGIYMEGVPQGILVKSLILGSPAEEGGVQPGDIIIMVKEHLAESGRGGRPGQSVGTTR